MMPTMQEDLQTADNQECLSFKVTDRISDSWQPWTSPTHLEEVRLTAMWRKKKLKTFQQNSSSNDLNQHLNFIKYTKMVLFLNAWSKSSIWFNKSIFVMYLFTSGFLRKKCWLVNPSPLSNLSKLTVFNLYCWVNITTKTVSWAYKIYSNKL